MGFEMEKTGDSGIYNLKMMFQNPQVFLMEDYLIKIWKHAQLPSVMLAVEKPVHRFLIQIHHVRDTTDPGRLRSQCREVVP